MAYNPPGDAIIHAEYITDLSTNGEPISISSNVALTIQRYSDANAQFTVGQRPIEDNEAMLTVSTNCQWGNYNPIVTLGGGNGDITSIDVNVQGDDLLYDDLFLWSTSSYHVEWSAKSESPSCTHHRHYRHGKDQRSDYDKEMPVFLSTTKHILGNGRSSSFKSTFQSLFMALTQYVIGYWPTATTTDNNNIVTASNVCIVNLELLLNGCSHHDDNIIISDTTPAVRYFNGVATSVEQNVNVQDECIVDNSANLNFTQSSEESLDCS